MTEAEARVRLAEFLAGRADYPVVWVGDLFAQGPGAFMFEATIHKPGEDPREDFQHWFVDRDTGRCGLDTE